MPELIYIGGAVKALDDAGRVGGYLVRFGDAAHKDLDGEYFTKNTYFGSHDADGSDCLFHHMLPVGDVPQELTDHIFTPLKTKKDDVGLFAETVLNLADEYEAKVFELVQAGKLGFSSGAAAHTVRKAKDGEIKRWIIAEGSFTPTPAEPQNRVVNIKSYGEMLKAVWTTSYVNDLPDSAFAFIESGGEKDGEGKTKPRSLRHFPYKDSDGKLDEAHVKNALARIPQSDLSDEDKAKALAVVKRAAKKLGVEVSESKSTKGIFTEIHEDRANSIYSLCDDLQCALWRAQMMDDMAEDAGIVFDFPAAVDEILNEFSTLIKQSLIEEDEEEDAGDMTPLGAKSMAVSAPLNSHSQAMVSVAKEFAQRTSAFKSLFTQYAERGTKRHEFRVKEGRTISQANRERMDEMHGHVKEAKGHLTEIEKGLQNLITMANPSQSVTVGETKSSEDLFVDFQRLRTELTIH
jgi:hypothetical protein